MQTIDVLRGYLESIRQLAGARAASLFIPAPVAGESAPFLCHTGEKPGVPELADRLSAERFIAAQHKRQETGGKTRKDTLVGSIPSATGNTYLLNVSARSFLRLLEQGEGLSRSVDRREAGSLPLPEDDEAASFWMGLRWPTDTRPLLPQAINPLANEADCRIDDKGFTWLLALSSHMVRALYQSALLEQDPLSQLPGRVKFQDHLYRLFKQSQTQQQPLSLLLVNPDDYATVNQRLGREHGDRVLAEVAERLRGSLRHSDLAFRYGGAVFAIFIPLAGREEAKSVADKLRHALGRHPYAGKAVRLAFSMGVAVYDPSRAGRLPGDADEMMGWADNAINSAKLAGGGRTMIWDPQDDTSAMGNLDRLSGIFTADTEKDYRNMLLLWDTVAFIASHREVDDIAKEFIQRIGAIFKPHRAAIFSQKEGEATHLLAEFVDNTASAWMTPGSTSVPLSEAQNKLLQQVQQHRHAERLRLQVKTDGASQRQHFAAYGVPMIVAESYQGCLYIEMAELKNKLDSSDLVFLSALAKQVANALSHARLAAKWKQEKERESSLLKEEVRGLRQALQHSKMLFHSPQMHAVMDRLQKVAPTDATVLITGESGTGKEMLASSLHDMSTRKDKPFVTVDCGAIAQSLLEAELFGRVKGAFTGADSSTPGRILQADGGTLFLDEIGELPLDLQAKLLRFVQEKEIMPVGAQRSQIVDVRIVAATNRNLTEEVALGRFRQDLYYRLQVFVINSVPLRGRPDDILPLAHYFLEKFCLQYNKGPLQLAADAEARLRQYPWPGNVRELQNQIHQMVVMNTAGSILAENLNLPVNEPHGAQWPLTATMTQDAEPANDMPQAQTNFGKKQHRDEPAGAPASSENDPWDALRLGLKGQLQQVLGANAEDCFPLGRWLNEDLVLMADEACEGVARRASSKLGMAETTLRRQVDKAKQDRRAGRLTRAPQWSAIQPFLSRLIDTLNESAQQNIIQRARTVLLEEVLMQLPDKEKPGAALMGVSLPTFRRWKDTISH